MKRVLLMLCAVMVWNLPAMAQYGYFDTQSTWFTKTGANQAAQIVTWNNPTSGSAAFINDILTYGGTPFVLNQGAYAAVHCTASNSDPLVTVTGVPTYQVQLGWNVLHIPTSCNAPGGDDGQVVIINTDDARFLWATYGAHNTGSTWTAASVRLWSRTAAAEGVNSAKGRGMGVESVYDGLGGGLSACRASVDFALGDILQSELDNGVIPHAMRFAYNGYRLLNGALQPYPCVSSAIGVDNRPAAGTMGQRLMFNPNIDVDSLNIGADMKTILKAAQEYGFIQSDGSPQAQFYLEKIASWSGYDFTTPGISDFFNYLFTNSREIPCLNAYTGECNGVDPPVTPPAPVTGAIGIDNTFSSNDSEASASTHTIYFTVGNHANRYLLAFIACQTSDAMRVSSITFNTSETMTRLGGVATANYNGLEVYGLDNPSVTSANIEFSLSSAGRCAMMIYSLYNLKPGGVHGFTSATSTPLASSNSINVSSLAGDLVIDAVHAGTFDDATYFVSDINATGSQTARAELYVYTDAGQRAYSSTLTATTTTTAMGASWDSMVDTSFAHVALAFTPNAGAGAAANPLTSGVFVSPVLH